MAALFNADHTLNFPEFVSRMKHWTDYAKTCAPADVEKATGKLSILCDILTHQIESNTRLGR